MTKIALQDWGRAFASLLLVALPVVVGIFMPSDYQRDELVSLAVTAIGPVGAATVSFFIARRIESRWLLLPVMALVFASGLLGALIAILYLYQL